VGFELTAPWRAGGRTLPFLAALSDKRRRRRASFSLSAPASFTPAASGSTGLWPVGESTARAKPVRHRELSDRLVPVRTTLAEFGLTERSPAGDRTVRGKRLPQRGYSSRSALVSTTPAGCEPTELWPVGDPATSVRPRLQPVRSAPSAQDYTIRVACGRTTRSPAGARTENEDDTMSDSPLRLRVHLPPSAPGTVIPAYSRPMEPWLAGDGMGMARRPRRRSRLRKSANRRPFAVQRMGEESPRSLGDGRPSRLGGELPIGGSHNFPLLAP